MSHVSEHLSSLRQEITDLRNRNALCSEQGGHSAIEQSALQLRNDRLLQIKRELLTMLNRSDNAVWWDKSRKPDRAACDVMQCLTLPD